jgi:poly(A) polymerase
VSALGQRDELRRALGELAGEGWLVGGAVRDRLLGRASDDFDVVVSGEARPLAVRLARRLKAFRFALSDDFGAWRVVARDRSWQIDLMPLLGETIEHDLARRDLTINAIAEPLGGGETIDPFGGRRDLEQGRLRMVGPRAFAEDPLRTLRLARIACELGFSATPETTAAARSAAPGLAQVAAERQFAELRRIIASGRALEGLEAMERLGATAVILPELVELRGVQQSAYHHLDVHDHSLQVLAEAVTLTRDPGTLFAGSGSGSGSELAALLGESLSAGLTRGEALRFGALLHDIAKPQTRSVSTAGRVSFMGHDELGAELARGVLLRLRAGERVAEHVASLTRHHLRLGFLVHQAPLSPRALYGYLRACGPVAVDVTLLSVADRLATRGRAAEEAIARHLELARAVIPAALRWRAQPPRPPLTGDRLAHALGMRPGPELGRLLAELEEASFAGEIAGEEQAIALARRLHEGSR